MYLQEASCNTREETRNVKNSDFEDADTPETSLSNKIKLKIKVTIQLIIFYLTSHVFLLASMSHFY